MVHVLHRQRVCVNGISVTVAVLVLRASAIHEAYWNAMIARLRPFCLRLRFTCCACDHEKTPNTTEKHEHACTLLKRQKQDCGGSGDKRLRVALKKCSWRTSLISSRISVTTCCTRGTNRATLTISDGTATICSKMRSDTRSCGITLVTSALYSWICGTSATSTLSHHHNLRNEKAHVPTCSICHRNCATSAICSPVRSEMRSWRRFQDPREDLFFTT